MKSAALSILTILCLSAIAKAAPEIPKELKGLFPVGSTHASMKGVTQDKKACRVRLDQNEFGMTVMLSVSNPDGTMSSWRFGNFQLGLGHNLMKPVEMSPTSLTAVSFHQAEESYGSDSKVTLQVGLKDSMIRQVRVLTEEKGLFWFITKSDETCRF